MIAGVCRFVAVAIAAGALIDPSYTAVARGRARVSVVEPARSRVADRLRQAYIVEHGFDPAADAVVFVGRTYPDVEIPSTTRVATVTLPTAGGAVSNVDAPPVVPAGTAIRIGATVGRRVPRKGSSIVTARIGGIVAGEARHQWTEAEERWRASVDIVPVGDPPYVITVSAGADDAAAVLVDRAPPLPVTFYEPRPSWVTTFVRRALERDRRFAVETVARLPPLLDAASVVVVGGLDRVTRADGATLDRFARVRGGTVVIIPDEAVRTGSPGAELVRAQADDQVVLLEEPAQLSAASGLPRFAASELISYRRLEPDATVLASLDEARAVVWTARRGAGRLVVSGALDAWRFRAMDDSAFDRFWRGVAAGAAVGTPPPVEVRATPSVVRAGETVHVRVRVQPSLAAVRDLAASAALLPAGVPVRLWPDAERGGFSAAFAAPVAARVHRIVVTVSHEGAQTTGAAAFAIAPEGPAAPDAPEALEAPEAPEAPAPPLALLAAAHGGVDVSPRDLRPLDRWLRATVSPPAVLEVRHPMRAGWWMVPLFVCLSLDWWITSSRRRRR